MPSIAQDPMLKSTIRNRLYALLYTPADNQMFERIKVIIIKNSVKVGAGHMSFMYKAVNYTCDDNKILPRPRNQLHSSMESAMAEYLQDAQDLAEEKPRIQGYLTQVLNASDHPVDWMQLLIPALHKPIQDMLKEAGESSFLPLRRMTPESVQAFLAKTQEGVNMTKQRLVMNLIT
mgnify:CR=1 FL=1